MLEKTINNTNEGKGYSKTWEGRKFRDPTENFVLRNINEPVFKNRQDQGVPPIEETFQEHVKNTISLRLEKAKENALSFEKEFGPEFLEKMNSVYNWVDEYFKEKGLDIDLPAIYLVKNEAENHFGHSFGSHLEIDNFNLIEEKEFKEIQTLSIIGHELYHATAKNVMEFYKKKDTLFFLANPETVHGASYRVRGEQKHMALEEGLAFLFQEFISKKIKTLFSDEIVNYYNEIETKMLDELKKDNITRIVQVVKLFINQEGITQVRYGGDQNNDASMEMVEYIASQIPNFYSLVEKARVERKTLDLARAIEKRFGEGSYRLVTSATVEEVKDIIKTLKDKTV